MVDTNTIEENLDVMTTNPLEPSMFDKLRLFTWADADLIKVGSKGYLSDNVQDIYETLQPESTHKLIEMEISTIYDKKYSNRFGASNGSYTIAKELFYLLDDPILRPYTLDELYNWWSTSDKKVLLGATMEEFWVKSFYFDKGYYMIFAINNGGETHKCTIRTFCNTFLKLDGTNFFMPDETVEEQTK